MNRLFNKAFLKEIMAIPSVSHREERMRDYILEFARVRGIVATTDGIGNVYLTKGPIASGEYVPCFVNHMDTVQKPQQVYVDRQEKLPVLERTNAEGQTELYVEGYGIGGDNKAGCAIALGLIDTLPKCKAVFFVQEELGFVGSKEMDYSFLSDVSLLITMDCWGCVRTASAWRKNGAKMYSPAFYDQVLKDVYERHGVTVRDHLANTDVCQMMMNCDLCCCDIANGGYHPHALEEYVCVEDAIKGYELILDLCQSLDGRTAYRMSWNERMDTAVAVV